MNELTQIEPKRICELLRSPRRRAGTTEELVDGDDMNSRCAREVGSEPTAGHHLCSHPINVELDNAKIWHVPDLNASIWHCQHKSDFNTFIARSKPANVDRMVRKRSMRAFGRQMIRWREERGYTAPMVSRDLDERFGIKLDSSTLYNYESGSVLAPDAVALWGLAQLYRIELEAMIMLIQQNRKADVSELPLPQIVPKSQLPPEEQEWLNLWRGLPLQDRKYATEQIRLLVKHHSPRLRSNGKEAS